MKGADRPIRVEDVARLAGVSPISVSRALSNPGRVSEATRLKVLAAVTDTGYAVNPLASGLKSGRSQMVVAITAALDLATAAALDTIAATLAETSLHLVLGRLPDSALHRTVRLNALLGLRPALMLDMGNTLSRAEQQRVTATGITLLPLAAPRDAASALRQALPPGTFPAPAPDP